MPISVYLTRACAALAAIGGVSVLAIAIDLSDLETALYSIPFLSASALLWGFSDIISLLQQMLDRTTRDHQVAAGSNVRHGKDNETPARSPEAIAKDIERLKGNAGT